MAGRITVENFSFCIYVSVCFFSFLLIITYLSETCTLYSFLSITAYDPSLRYNLGF